MQTNNKENEFFYSVHENTENKELGKYLGRTSLVINAYVFICH